MKKMLLFFLLAAVPLLGYAADSRTLQADIPAAGISQLTLSTGVGELHVTPSSDDAVHVNVVLRQKSVQFMWFFHWMSSSSAKQMAEITLNRQQQGDQLSISLDYPGSLDSGDVKQEWHVQVPARLALGVAMKVGQASIKGIAGGVSAGLNVGQLDVSVPRGTLSAEVNVGQIRAVSASTRPGDISLSTTIGDATLYMNGKFVGHAGARSGLGRSINVSGAGADSMKLNVNVGEVSLHIQPPDDGK